MKKSILTSFLIALFGGSVSGSHIIKNDNWVITIDTLEYYRSAYKIKVSTGLDSINLFCVAISCDVDDITYQVIDSNLYVMYNTCQYHSKVTKIVRIEQKDLELEWSEISLYRSIRFNELNPLVDIAYHDNSIVISIAGGAIVAKLQPNTYMTLLELKNAIIHESRNLVRH